MDRIELSPVTHKSHEFLYDLLKERDPSANISHRELPTWEQHVAFVESRPYLAWYIVSTVMNVARGFQDIGSAYITKQAEIGIFLFKDFQGHGFGSATLDVLMRKHPLPRYLANVAPGNGASQKFFVGQGFRHIQNTYELRVS